MPETLVEQLEVADVYAAALFELAREARAVETVRAELEELVRLAQSDPAFAAFLRSGAVDTLSRRLSLERMFRGRVSDLLLDTLQVMNDHGRAHLLAALHRDFVLRQERAADEVEVTVHTAVPLAPAQQAEITRLAAELSGKHPLVTWNVDPDVIGGLVMQIEEFRFDCSLRRQLQMARAGLLERSSRGLDIPVETAPLDAGENAAG